MPIKLASDLYSAVDDPEPLIPAPPKRKFVLVEDPIARRPSASTEKRFCPVEEETTNGVRLPDPWMLNVTFDDVAPTPSTVPLSRSVEVLSVVLVVHLDT
jgi:hypothetical protein